MEGWAYDANKGGWGDGGNPAKPSVAYVITLVLAIIVIMARGLSCSLYIGIYRDIYIYIYSLGGHPPPQTPP